MNLRIKISAFILFICLSSCADALSGNSKEEEELFDKIKVGMTVSEVEQILGKPEGMQIDSKSNNTMYYYYFTESKSGMRSDLPTVIFDSTKIVKYSSYN